MKVCLTAAAALCAIALSANVTLAQGTSFVTPPAGGVAFDASGHPLGQDLHTADTPKPHLDTSGVNMQPNYPASALPNKESGSVAIHVFVRDDGTVRKIDLAGSSGYEDLDTAAANAVLHWKFHPAMKDGQPVGGDTIVQVSFASPN